MPFTFAEFKRWLDANPQQWTVNTSFSTVSSIWESSWLSLLARCQKNPSGGNKIIQQWITEQGGIKVRDITLVGLSILQSEVNAKRLSWERQMYILEQRGIDRFNATQQIVLSLNNEIDRYIREVHIHPLDPSAASSHYQKLVDNKKRQLNWIKNQLNTLFDE